MRRRFSLLPSFITPQLGLARTPHCPATTSRRTTHWLYSTSLIGVLCCALAACGGGGGGTTSSSTTSTTSNTNNNNSTNNNGNTNGSNTTNILTEVLNPGYSGTLYFENPNGTWQMDLSTGVVQTLRKRDIYAGDSKHLFPSADGTEFAFTSYSLAGTDKETLHIVDANGLTKASFDAPAGFDGEAKLSPNGQYLLVKWGDDSLIQIPYATVFDRQGNRIKRFDGYTDYAWLPDGRMVLAKQDGIYLVDKNFGTPTLLKQIPNGSKPNFLSPSPDGQKIAFVLGSADLITGTGTGSNLNMINIDGSGLRQVATADGGVEGAGWSPDSKYMIVRSPIVSGIQLGLTPTCPELWVIASDASSPIKIVNDQPNTALRLSRRNENGDADRVCSESVAQWRTTAVAPASVAGTTPGETGLNAGLTGRIWTQGAPQYGFWNLNTGLTTTTFGKSGDKAYPAFDGSEIAFYSALGNFKNNKNYYALLTADLNGVSKNGFELTDDSFTGSPKLSPNGQNLAVEWHSFAANGDPGGIRVLNLFKRDGTVLARYNQVSDWVWHPDGSVLAVSGQDIYRIGGDFSTSTLLATLSDVPTNIAVSPDGSKLAFQMAGHIWTANLDGSNMKRMTVSQSIDDNPIWSPDGKWIAFTHKNLGSGPTCDIVHVIPADSERLYIGQDGLLNHDIEVAILDTNGQPRPLCAFSRLGWFN